MFGDDARANLVEVASEVSEDLYRELVTQAGAQIAARPRTRPTNLNVLDPYPVLGQGPGGKDMPEGMERPGPTPAWVPGPGDPNRGGVQEVGPVVGAPSPPTPGGGEDETAGSTSPKGASSIPARSTPLGVVAGYMVTRRRRPLGRASFNAERVSITWRTTLIRRQSTLILTVVTHAPVGMVSRIGTGGRRGRPSG